MISICLAYLIFTFREFKSIHKGKTAILHLRFGTEKNRRLGSKKARYNRAFRKRHLFCLHIMVGVTGFEPAASCSQSRRATNCATPRFFYFAFFVKLSVLPCFVRRHTASTSRSRHLCYFNISGRVCQAGDWAGNCGCSIRTYAYAKKNTTALAHAGAVVFFGG